MRPLTFNLAIEGDLFHRVPEIDRFLSITASCTLSTCVIQCCRHLSIGDHDGDVCDDCLVTGLPGLSDGGQTLQRDSQS